MLILQAALRASSFAEERLGKMTATSREIIATTTSSSISVNAGLSYLFFIICRERVVQARSLATEK